MSVNIHISGETAAEALRELSVLAAPLAGGQAAAPVSTEAPKTDKPSRGSRTTAKQDPTPEKEETKEPNPVKDEQPEQQEQQEQQEHDPEEEGDEGPVPTVVELRAKATEVGAMPEGKQKVKGLLDEFGSKSISDVPEGKRAAFMKALEAL